MLKSKLSEIIFPSFTLNASGINNEILKQLTKIADSKAGGVVFKSCSVELRKGNQNPKYIVKSSLIPGCTFNSMGLPNKGLTENLEYVKYLKNYTQKPLIMSIVGIIDPIAENQKMVGEFQKQDLLDFIEVNLSCPNIEGEGILGYDFESVKKIVNTLTKIEGRAKIGFKLPPYTDITQFQQISEILLNSKTAFVTSINTLPGLVVDPQKESVIIKPKNGQGGLGGDFIKPLALYNVRQLFEKIGSKIDIIGVGGIKNGQDAFEFLLAGASLVQIGTGFAHQGIEVFEKINMELEQILLQKNYKSTQEVKGKLKFL